MINGVFGSERITNAIIDPSTTGGYSSYTSTTSVDAFWLWGAAIAYFSLLEGLFGDTLGKALVGIKVTDLTGRPAGWRAVLIRNVLRIVDSFPGFYLVGAPVARFSPRRQRIGDHIAGTLVVPARVVVGPGLSAQSRRRRVAVLLTIMIAFAGSCFAFAYYGRPPIVLANIAHDGQFPGGPVANYQHGPARWSGGSVTYPVTYRLAGSGKQCSGEITLIWHGFPGGWQEGTATSTCQRP